MSRKRMERDWDEMARADAVFYTATSFRTRGLEEAFSRGRLEAYVFTVKEFRRLGFDPSGKRMLEIGCGIGRQTRGFSELFGEVCAVDLSGEMLLRARKMNEDLGNVSFRKTSGYDLEGLPDGCFDFVFSYAVFQHITEKWMVSSYLREIRRVLKEGGLFKIHLSTRSGFTSALGFFPVPRSLLYRLPRRVRVRFHGFFFGVESRMRGRGSLRGRESWFGTAFSEDQIVTMVASSGLELIELSDDVSHPRGTRVWVLGRKGHRESAPTTR